MNNVVLFKALVVKNTDLSTEQFLQGNIPLRHLLNEEYYLCSFLDGNLPSKNKWLRPLNNNNKKVFIVKLYDVPVVGNTL